MATGNFGRPDGQRELVHKLAHSCSLKRRRQFAAALRRCSLSLAITAMFSMQAVALPVNPSTTDDVTFNTTGGAMEVTNSVGAIIKWDSFSISSGESVNFIQPDASSSVLNRVVGAAGGAPALSSIHGQLTSNGKVWLINPAGILIGAGGVVDTAGFVASAIDISNENFLAGEIITHTLADDVAASDAAVTNEGGITTPSGGFVYLIGQNARNNGAITADNGEVILAAGKSVTLVDSGAPGVSVEVGGAAGRAVNLGEILSDSGRIGLVGAVLAENRGVINANTAALDKANGRIFLRSTPSGEVNVSGNDASSCSLCSTGGDGSNNISLEGGNVLIDGDVNIESGGGIDITAHSDAINKGVNILRGGRLTAQKDIGIVSTAASTDGDNTRGQIYFQDDVTLISKQGGDITLNAKARIVSSTSASATFGLSIGASEQQAGRVVINSSSSVVDLKRAAIITSKDVDFSAKTDVIGRAITIDAAGPVVMKTTASPSTGAMVTLQPGSNVISRHNADGVNNKAFDFRSGYLNINASTIKATGSGAISLQSDGYFEGYGMTLEGAGDVNIDAARISLFGTTNNGQTPFVADSVTAVGDVTLTVADSLNLGGSSLTSTAGDVTLQATSGRIVTSKPSTVTTEGPGDINLLANTNVGAGGLKLEAKQGDINLAAGNGYLWLYADDLVDSDITASGDVVLQATNGDLKLDGGAVSSSAGGISVTSTNSDISINGAALTAANNLDLSAEGGDITLKNNAMATATSSDLTATAKTISLDDSMLQAGGKLTRIADDGKLELVNNAMIKELNGALSVSADNDITLSNGLSLAADGNLDITSTSGAITLDEASLSAAKITHSASGGVTTLIGAAKLAEANGDLSAAADSVDMRGGAALAADHDLTVTANTGDITADGSAFTAANKLSLTAAAGKIAFSNGASATATSGDLTVTAKTISLDDSTLQAGGKLTRIADDGKLELVNNAMIKELNGALTVSADNDITLSNGLSLAADHDLAVSAKTITLTDSTMKAGGKLTRNADDGTLEMTGGALLQESKGDVTATAGGDITLSNGLQLTASQQLAVTAGGSVTLNGPAGNPASMRAGVDRDLLVTARDSIVLRDGAFMKSSGVGDVRLEAGANIVLSNGAYISAGDDAYLRMSAANSRLAFNSPGDCTNCLPAWVVTDVDTKVIGSVHLDFPARASGGVFIAGVETVFATNGSGLFVLDTNTPAATTKALHQTFLGRTEEIYTPPTEEISSSDLTKPLESVDATNSEATVAAIAPDPVAPADEGQTVGGGENEFAGGQEEDAAIESTSEGDMASENGDDEDSEDNEQIAETQADEKDGENNKKEQQRFVQCRT